TGVQTCALPIGRRPPRRPLPRVSRVVGAAGGASVQGGHEPGGRDRAVGVLAQLGDLLPVDRAVQADPDPAPAAHVGRAEEPVRIGGDEFGLYAGWCGTPQVRERVLVVTVL